jgi:hypothetical protein
MIAGMRNALAVIAAACLAACGGHYPEPKEAEASTAAAVRSASEVGADKDPQATLHLKFAKDQSDDAAKLISNGDNQRAESMLARARADAELSLMLARAHNEESEASSAEAEVADKRKKLGK